MNYRDLADRLGKLLVERPDGQGIDDTNVEQFLELYDQLVSI